MKIVSEFQKKVEERRRICAACEHKKLNGVGSDTCGICGCIVYAKTLTPTTECPDQPPRWT